MPIASKQRSPQHSNSFLRNSCLLYQPKMHMQPASNGGYGYCSSTAWLLGMNCDIFKPHTGIYWRVAEATIQYNEDQYDIARQPSRFEHGTRMHRLEHVHRSTHSHRLWYNMHAAVSLSARRMYAACSNTYIQAHTRTK